MPRPAGRGSPVRPRPRLLARTLGWHLKTSLEENLRRTWPGSRRGKRAGAGKDPVKCAGMDTTSASPPPGGSPAPVPHFISLPEEPHAERFLDAVLTGVLQAGSPYLQWFFGGADEACSAMLGWMARPSSEIFLGRAVLRTVGNVPVGGFLALGGADLARSRQADAVAALTQAEPEARRAIALRIAVARELFPPVEADELYLTKVWVTDEARRAGHGAALVGEYLAAGARHGFRRFRLDVFSGNHAAIQLYRSFGFEILEERSSQRAGMSYTSMVRA